MTIEIKISEFLEQKGWSLRSVERVKKKKRVHFTCDKGHDHYIMWDKLKRGQKCGKCYPKKQTIEMIRSKFEDRGFTLLSEVYQNDLTGLKAKCPKGHIFETNWRNFRRAGCTHPECKGNAVNDDEYIRAEIEKEVGYRLASPYKNARTPLKLICPKGHHFQVTWNKWKTSGVRCSACFTTKQFSKENIEPFLRLCGYSLLSTSYQNQETKLTVQCPSNHVFETYWKNFRKGSRCTRCQENQPESDIGVFLEDELRLEIERRNRKLIGGFEIDIYVPSHKLAIEYCGLHWHDELARGTDYHSDKLSRCTEKGIRLLTIFEDEWLEKQRLVLNRLRVLAGKVEKAQARECTIIELGWPPARVFLEENHLQGAGNPSRCFGLYHNGQLRQILAISPNQWGNKEQTISRLCTKSGYVVVGGASKLFEHVKHALSLTKVVTFADRRWSEGNVYRHMGFKMDKILKPDYSYHNGKQYRRSKQSLKKTPEERLSNLTERELRLQQGWRRIYDCGKVRYVWDAHSEVSNS